VPILLVDGQQVEATKSENGYKYVLTAVGDTSLYATSAKELSLTAKAKVLDDATMQTLSSISPDGSVFTFTGITPYLKSIQPDDVIVSGVTEATPYGLLRKITNITIDGSQITVETTQATLEEVIKEGLLQINKPLTAADIMFFVPLKEGVTLQEVIPGPVQAEGCLLPISLSQVFYDFDGDENTTGDQIKLNGTACLDPTFNFGLDIGWSGLNYLLFSVGISEYINLELDAQYSLSYTEKFPVATIYFTPLEVGPVVFLPVLTVNVGIDGGLSAGITTSVTQYAGLKVGLSYSDGDWSPITDFTFRFEYSLPTLHVGAHVKVYAEPKFDLLLYAVAGPYVRLQGYLDLQMDPLGDPWLSLYGGIESAVGVEVEVLGKTLAKYEFPHIFDYKKLLAQLAGNQRPWIVRLLANPSSVAPGGTSTVTVVAQDSDGDPLTCEWSTDKGTLSSTTGCDPVTWTAPATPGTANVSVSVTDNIPRHNPSPATQSVKIGICTYLSIDPTSASYEKGGGSGTINVTAPPGCAWTAKSNESWITITAGSSGTGSGTISYRVQEASGNYPSRTGNIATPGKTFTFTQTNGRCEYHIDDPKLHSDDHLYGPSGGFGSVDVTTNASACPWEAISEASWITIARVGSSGTGRGRVSYTVAANTGLERNGRITLNVPHNSTQPKKFNVYQEGAPQPLPGPPTGLSATDGTYTDKVRITWTAPTTGGAPTGYRIYRYTSNSSEMASEIGTSASTPYDDYVGDFYDHWYWVKAYNSAGSSVSFSNGNTGSRQRMYLSVTLDGGGTVTGPGINCGYAGNDCSEIYFYGTSVTLTANPLWPPWMFQAWYGCDSTSNLNCTVIMNNSRTVTPGYNAYEPP